MNISSRYFISCVTNEFASYRTHLRTHLTGLYTEVKIQEDFAVPERMLDLLDDYIRVCTCVVHLIGRSSGARPVPAEVDRLFRKHPELRNWGTIQKDLASSASPYSYTQWEAYLADFHDVKLLSFEASTESKRELGWTEKASEVIDQVNHIQRLRNDLGRWIENITFQDAHHVAVLVYKSVPHIKHAVSRMHLDGDVAIGASCNEALVAAVHMYQEAQRLREEVEAKQLFAALFGTPSSLRRSDHGWHPDNREVHDRLCRLFGFCDAAPVTEMDSSLQDANFEGDLVSFGGPNSTALTMLAWEFEGRTNRTLRREPDALLPLRYTGVSDEGHERVPHYRVAYRQPGIDGYHLSVPWPFFDESERQFVAPSRGALIGEITDGNGKRVKCYEPVEDYLVVTRIPNFVGTWRAGAPEHWPKLTVFDGGMGIGTRGAELLASPAGLEVLTSVQRQIGRIGGFQAAFRVYDPEICDQGYHRFRKIELKERSLALLPVDAATYEKLHRKVRKRIATVDWASFDDR